jgi:hypothetical protein
MADIRLTKNDLDPKLSLSSTDILIISDYDDIDINGYPATKYIEFSTLQSEVSLPAGVQGNILYHNGANWVVLAPGVDGQFLKCQGAAANPIWEVPAGSGDVTKVGTPVDNQIGIWTGDGTIEGSLDLTFDGTDLEVGGNILATVFDTNNIAYGLTMSYATIAADGTLPDIDIALTPKGAGGLVIGVGVPAVTTNKLYNNGGTLYWNGTDLTAGGGGGAFATAANITSNSPGTLGTDSFVFGSTTLTDVGSQSSRFQFNKSLSTFCAGYASTTAWNSVGQFCAIFGEDCQATDEYNFVAGALNTTSGTNNAIFGNTNSATGANYNIITGEQNVVTGDWNAVLGDWHDTISGDNNLIGGTSHSCAGDTNVIGGTANNITQATAVDNAVFGNNNNITVASSVCNLVSGLNNAVSESYNIVGGWGNTVQGRYNIVGGISNTFSSSAWYCLVSGDTHTINNSYQSYFGDAGASSLPFSMVKSSTTNRQKQEVLINYDTSGVQTVNIDIVGDDIILPASTVYSFTAEILGVQTGGVTGSAGDLWKYRIKGIIKRDGANNTTYVAAAEEKEVIIEADAAIDVVAQANDTTEALEFQATTVANRDIRWVGSVEFLEIQYA